MRASPAALLQLPLWLLQGRAAFKREVAQRTSLDVSTLPYRPEVLDFVRRAREAGRRTILATASDGKVARRVAEHLGLFDAVLASDGERNVKGANKLAAILADTGGKAFSYAGDHSADLEVWRGAEAAVVVSRSGALARRAAGLTEVEAVIKPKRVGLGRYLYGLRAHQWLKNLLVFLPLMPVLHELTQALLVDAVLAFLAFGLMASGIYVLNDLLDLESDRRHHRKRRRPFAAGDISPSAGLAMSITLGIASLTLSVALLPASFVGVLLALCGADHRLLGIPQAARGGGRVRAGRALHHPRGGRHPGDGAAALLLDPLVLPLHLPEPGAGQALRGAHRRRRSGGDAVQLKRDRGYVPGDATFVLCTGVAAGQMSALLLSLYLHDQQMLARYGDPEYLWALVPVFLFWTVRIWLKAVRGALHDDPVVFAARDWVSRLAVGIGAVGALDGALSSFPDIDMKMLILVAAATVCSTLLLFALWRHQPGIPGLPRHSAQAQRLSAAWRLWLVFLLSGLVASAIVALAVGEPRESSLGYLRFVLSLHNGDDSWMPMLRASAFLREHPDQPLYHSVFFGQHVKFQYPLTALLPLDLPQWLLRPGAGHGGR